MIRAVELGIVYFALLVANCHWYVFINVYVTYAESFCMNFVCSRATELTSTMKRRAMKANGIVANEMAGDG